MGKSNKKGQEFKKISLPYDFIPFPHKYDYYYNYNNLPKHNEHSGIDGCIEYEMTPCTDMIVDLKKANDNFYISGSTIRGSVRSNLEIMSRSYPIFIQRDQFAYRDIAGNMKNDYMKKMLLDKNKLEESIKAGILVVSENKYYIKPAKKISSKNFLKISESRLHKMGTNGFNSLFENFDLRKLSEYEEKILKLSNSIKRIRKENDVSKDVINDISKIMKKYYKRNLDSVDRVNSELIYELPEYSGLINLYVERLKEKCKMNNFYKNLSRNKNYRPYQKNVGVIYTENGGIHNLVDLGSNQEYEEEVTLFNSSNVSSKRYHYIIGNTNDDNELLEIKDECINSYNSSYRKFERMESNISKLKFYNLFNLESKKYDFVDEKQDNMIVFYNEIDGEIKNIGRTPYFKVMYNTSIESLIGEEKNHEKKYIDLARAMFGFTIEDFKFSSSKEKIGNYKSRLRFTPAEVHLTSYPKTFKSLLLLSPNASAYGMYLVQNDQNKLLSYEDDNITLNGYKYYKLINEKNNTENENNVKDNSEIYKERLILEKNSVNKIKGKVYFTNLNEFELGLLLGSIDCNMLGSVNNKYYDSIGGGKAYGYGRVRFNVKNLIISKNSNMNSFGSWFRELVHSPQEYIGVFKSKIEKDHLKYLDHYLKSKTIYKGGEIINWDMISGPYKNDYLHSFRNVVKDEKKPVFDKRENRFNKQKDTISTSIDKKEMDKLEKLKLQLSKGI
jgi:CRISPR-associated protein (TIGR03986 family)